jgi:tetratricopeptide (TPR) repeat protein
MTSLTITTEAILNALTNEWQPITALIYKLRIKEMIDARYLQIKLKELERKNLILAEIKMGKTHYKLSEPDLEIDKFVIDGLEFNELQSLDDAIASYEAACDHNEYLNEQDFRVDDDIIFNIMGFNDLGAVFFKYGEYQLALEANQKALELDNMLPRQDINPLRATVLRDIGNVFAKRSDYQEAVKYYENALDLSESGLSSPFNQEVLFNLGTAYSNLKQPENAIACFEKIAKHDPELDIVWNALGLAYSANKEYDKAIECFGKALQFNPSDKDIIDKLSSVVKEMKKREHFSHKVSQERIQGEEDFPSVPSMNEVVSLLEEFKSSFGTLVELAKLTSTINIKSYINDHIKPYFDQPSKKKIKKLKKSLQQQLEVWPEEMRKEFLNEYLRTIKRYEELQPPKWKKYGSTLLKLIPILR